MCAVAAAAFALATLLVSPFATADLLLEPYAGAVLQGQTKLKFTDALGGQETKSTQDGYAGGARLGLTVLGIGFVALDGWAAQGKSKSDSTTDDYQSTNATIAVGASALGLARAYAAVGLTQFSLKQASGTTQSYSGNVIKVGAGASIIPMVSLNVELVRQLWTKHTPSGGSEEDVSVKLASNESSYLLVSASLPFYF